MAKLTLVSVGLQAVESGMQPLPPTHKLRKPWTSELGSATDVSGSVPIRVVPCKCVLVACYVPTIVLPDRDVENKTRFLHAMFVSVFSRMIGKN